VKRRLKNIPVLQSAILLSAIALGAATGMGMVPRGITASLPSMAHSWWAITIAAVAWISFIVIALRLFAKGAAKDACQKQLLDSDLLDALFEHIPDNVFFKDLDSRFVRISSSMAKYCGLSSPAAAVNKTDADIFSYEHAAEALADEKQIIQTGQAFIEKQEKEIWPDGRECWVLTSKLPLRTPSGQIIGTMGISRNITDQKQTEIKVRHLAIHDALTGLPNRIRLEECLTEAIVSARHDSSNVAVLLIDLDQFKYVNASLGHYIGDRLLEAVAARLKRTIRAADTLARLGEDEFVIALSGIGSNENVESAASKVLKTLADPFEVEQHNLIITASMGISQFPDHGQNPETLLQQADVAMHNAKKKGRGHFSLFSPALTDATRRQHKIEADLRDACAQDEFVIHYQPIIDSVAGRINGMEALLRWKHPKHGLISPDQFIPQLEELGLMVDAGRWVMRTACRQAVEWTRRGLPPLRMAVNVSSQQFYEGNIVDTVESVLRETGLNPALFELELTESRVLNDSEAVLSIMKRLKRIGVTLSLDDFGTGWSSLCYLRQFPFNRIKIDRSFIRDLDTQPMAAAMVKSIVEMANNLRFSSVAEGVETSQQKDFLRKLNCPEMQGYYFSRPLPSVDATALLCSGKFKAKGDSTERSAPSDRGGFSSARIHPDDTEDGDPSWIH
jgi:diguanylate cyclase (GGDEF)-like protein/PAS domain S-box-containing protein